MNNIIRKILKRITRPFTRGYKIIRSQKPFIKFFNKTARKKYLEHPPKLTSTQISLVENLKQNGIAITTLSTLFPNEERTGLLIAFAKKKSDEATEGRKKKFLEYVWGEGTFTMEMENPFNKIAVDKKILDVVNSYMEIYSKFVFSSLNITRAISEGAEAQGSQRWHRDPAAGDEKICKVFIYLNDVDESTGPFQYCKKTHKSGALNALFPAYTYDGFYPPQNKVEETVGKENILSATGLAGTVIFCDTTGLHKGGYSTNRSRMMSTFFYVSPASLQKTKFAFPPLFEKATANLPEESRFALRK